eukprot:snap_masked-scaffold2794_size12335-processed-gene-0.1 protein:Tk09145 transcript:snap_masked-scaffold2794_size12335-processed-gene-0.1-mRNA-1 annotation:"trna pseudouridine synthase b"
MLPICFGEGTKFAAHNLLDADKQYIAEATLGHRSTTGDLEGDLIDAREVPANLDELLPAALAKFRGDIEQIPPMHSALKHGGTPLYKIARAGRTVEREKRSVTIGKLELVGRHENKLKLRVSCSKGTYIRTLVEDLGEELGCGAHTTLLHREWVEPFVDMPMHDIESIEELAKRSVGYSRPELDAMLLPIDSALPHLPEWHLKNDDEQGIFWFGNPVEAPGQEDVKSIRIYCPRGMFLGLAYCKNETIKPLRLIARKNDL